MFSIKVLDLKQQGYPDWFRGLRLILTLVGDSVYPYLQKDSPRKIFTRQSNFSPGCSGISVLQPGSLHGHWHHTFAEHASHLIDVAKCDGDPFNQ